MGADKSRLRLGGRTLLSHVCRMAKQTGLPVRIIRRDLLPGCGPLGGVFTALKSSSVDGEIFLACDMPFVSAALLSGLIRDFRRRGRPLFVLLEGRIGFPFALPVASLPMVERQIRSRRFSLQALAGAMRASVVACAKSDASALFNVNTPKDWTRARQMWQDRPGRDGRSFPGDIRDSALDRSKSGRYTQNVDAVVGRLKRKRHRYDQT